MSEIETILTYITDKLDFVNTKREKSSEGYLIVRDSRLAKTGVLNYRSFEIPFMTGAPSDLPRDQVIRVYRGEQELFKPEVLDSFKSKPITLNHPGSLVDSRTIKKDSVGFSKDDVDSKGEFMESTLVITDFETIKEVEAGTKELSLGYTADILWQPGVAPDGSPYDAVQRNIQGNHIAIVPRGRCGSDCHISDSQPQNKNRGKHMPELQKVILDGISYDCPAQTAQAFAKVLEGKDSQIKVLKDTKKELEDELEEKEEEAKKTEDEMQAKLDEAESKKVSDADLDTLVEERKAVIDTATSIVKDFDPKGKSNDEIRKAVVMDRCPDLPADKSQDYINARFDGLADSVKSNEGSAILDAMTDHAKGAGEVNDSMSDANMSYSEKIRAKKIQERKAKRGA